MSSSLKDLITINLCRCWNEPEHGAAYSTNQWKTAMHKTAPLLTTRVPNVGKGTSGMVWGCTCLSASIWEQLDGMPHSMCCFITPLIFFKIWMQFTWPSCKARWQPVQICPCNVVYCLLGCESSCSKSWLWFGFRYVWCFCLLVLKLTFFMKI